MRAGCFRPIRALDEVTHLCEPFRGSLASDGSDCAFGQVPPSADAHAKETGIEIKQYNVIYDLVDDIRKAMEGMMEPEEVRRFPFPFPLVSLQDCLVVCVEVGTFGC